MSHVFSFCELETLAYCRETCSRWRILATTKMRGHVVVKISTVAQLKTYVKLLSFVPAELLMTESYQIGRLRLRREVDELGNPHPGLLHEDLEKTSIGFFPVYTARLKKYLDIFFDHFGNHIISLELSIGCKVPSKDYRRWLETKTNSLKELSIAMDFPALPRQRGFFKDGAVFHKTKITLLSLNNASGGVTGPFLGDIIDMTPNVQRITTVPFFQKLGWHFDNSTQHSHPRFTRALKAVLHEKYPNCTHLTYDTYLCQIEFKA